MARNPNSDKNLRPFEKGDPRINRKGRPKNFDKLRLLAQGIACEVARDKETGEPLVDPADGHILTVAEAMLKQMALDRRQRRLFLEIAYGKVPDELVIRPDGGAIPVQLVDYRKGLDEEEGGEG